MLNFQVGEEIFEVEDIYHNSDEQEKSGEENDNNSPWWKNEKEWRL